MYVYVLDGNGAPLMPTKRCAKVRHMLKDGRAQVVKRTPFTIQLCYEPATHVVQDVTSGVDAGYSHVGLSATTPDKEFFASDVELRNDIVRKLSIRKELRRSRRSRKTRYRKPRFDNRKIEDGRISPSVRQKIDTHKTVIRNMTKIMPISAIKVEVSPFDIQKIMNPDISGKEYQQGPQLGFWNVREYVLWRDKHECQGCHGVSGDHILNVHHIESRKTGGNAPNNLVTLCETCHKDFHAGKIELKLKRGKSFKAATFMGIMRNQLVKELREEFEPQGIKVEETFGYITKNTRIEHHLPKDHYIDARCISGNPDAKPCGYVLYQKKVRCHNRQLHKVNFRKGGVRRNNQSSFDIKGFHLYEKVQYCGDEYFIFGKRTSGRFDIRTLDGMKVNNGSVSYKKLTPLEYRHNILIERRCANSSSGLVPEEELARKS